VAERAIPEGKQFFNFIAQFGVFFILMNTYQIALYAAEFCTETQVFVQIGDGFCTAAKISLPGVSREFGEGGPFIAVEMTGNGEKRFAEIVVEPGVFDREFELPNRLVRIHDDIVRVDDHFGAQTVATGAGAIL
jgi:hypothetical protein